MHRTEHVGVGGFLSRLVGPCHAVGRAGAVMLGLRHITAGVDGDCTECRNDRTSADEQGQGASPG